MLCALLRRGPSYHTENPSLSSDHLHVWPVYYNGSLLNKILFICCKYNGTTGKWLPGHLHQHTLGHMWTKRTKNVFQIFKCILHEFASVLMFILITEAHLLLTTLTDTLDTTFMTGTNICSISLSISDSHKSFRYTHNLQVLIKIYTLWSVKISHTINYLINKTKSNFNFVQQFLFNILSA